MSMRTWAEQEMQRAKLSDDERRVFGNILDTFFGEFDSGGAVTVGLDVLVRLISGQPLSPLTGADDEWMHVGGHGGDIIWQNVRQSTVFKNADGRAYDIDVAGRPTITFPYMPVTRGMRFPMFEIDTDP